MIDTKWDRRIGRATELTSSCLSAAEVLRVYARVATFQKGLYAEIEQALIDSPKISSALPLRGELDLFLLLPHVPRFLSVIEQIAPPPLAQAAARFTRKGPAGWQQAIEDFWRGDSDLREASSFDQLLAWIYLQPYAEYLADHREGAVANGTPLTCPLCGSKPIVGVLRSEGDGAKKSLICMLCAHEWNFRRIYCPGCGEEREPQMAFYAATEIAHVRVDVCDSCRHYLKTVDLTKDGRAVPVVDDLATIPLDLWATEHGYTKWQTNLLGI